MIGPPIFYLQSEAHKSGGYRTNDSKRSHKWVLWVAASAATSKPMNNWALAPEARSALRLWGGWAAGPSSHFSFYLTAPIEERTALLQSTGSFRNEGAPRVRRVYPEVRRVPHTSGWCSRLMICHVLPPMQSRVSPWRYPLLRLRCGIGRGAF